MADPRDRPTPSCDPRIEEPRRALARKWALIPLDGKIPVQKGWQKRPPADLSTVYGWVCKGRNLGLRTGKISGVVVIDDDSPDGSASAALSLPMTVSVVTGSGKRHFYFQAPADIPIGNSVKTLADGIDVRGDGGQVAFVGSIHPDTKKPYTWAPGLSPEEVEIAALPDDLLTKLRAQPKAKTKSKPKPKPTLKIVTDGEHPAPTEPTDRGKRIAAYVNKALEGETDRVLASVEGTRNDTLNKSAFALGQLVGAGALDHERARAALHTAAISIGLSDAEADGTIGSGLQAGASEPRDLGTTMSSQPNHDHGGAEEPGEDSRPAITIYGGWLHSAVSKAERILLRHSPPLLYQRGTTLVRIAMLPEAGAGRSLCRKPVIQEVTSAALIDRLTSLICWQKKNREGEIYSVDCPERIALTLLSRSGSWNLFPLVGVLDSPTLRSNGGILAREGYDRTSGLYVALGGQHWPPIPDRPTQDEARAALDKLRWVVKDFPFLESADGCVAMAAILTALIRPSLRTSPMFAFRAAKMGSGKSLLADIVSLIAAGRQAAVMSQGADENEDKKRMLPILAEGDPVAVIDNIERPFGSAALCSILTQTTWRDRVLGKSQTLSLPTANTTWIATGNNIVFEGDITTRTLVCDLDPRCERPEERKFEVNLHRYIPEHRLDLVVAGLTVLRAYHCAGRPDMGLPVFGRFEEWSDWVRSALVWLGLPDPCATRHRLEAADPVRTQLAGLLAALHASFKDATFQVSEVLSAAQEDIALREAVAPIVATASPGQGHGQCLGIFFQRVDRRPEGGIRLVRGASRGGSATWRIERV
ncbi:MAG: bifunctional DNA primase/polymerase [Planctomycetes bacterium]|nr:bifunctional DNA primase/polymerase [Planctomycetota bacterium]